MTETKTATIPRTSRAEPCRIFVRNLSHRTAKMDIEALFTRIGPLTETSMAVNGLKRQMGFAFVTFKMAEHATNAISALNGTSFQGREFHLLPSIAKEPPRPSLQRDATAGETSRRSGQSQHGATLAKIKMTREPGRIFGHNLGLSTSKKDIKALFAKFGPITKNKMHTNYRRQTRIAFVTLGTAEQAETAISALNQTRFQGGLLHLTTAEAENHPRGSIQRDATAEETPRRNGQSQGDTKREYAAKARQQQGTGLKLRETSTTPDSPQDGPPEHPSNLGEPQCPAKRQGRMQYRHAEGRRAGSRPRPSPRIPKDAEYNWNPGTCECTLLNHCTLACDE